MADASRTPLDEAPPALHGIVAAVTRHRIAAVVTLPLLAALLAALLGALLAVLLGGCATAQNYGDPVRPRYAGSYLGSVAPDSAGTTAPPPFSLHVVTFNIKFSLHPDRALDLFQRYGELGSADVVLLQEMDAYGVDRIARQLRMAYVYYPATKHPQSKRDFGNAILARWPLVDDGKLVLPHNGRIGKTQRIAVKATVVIHGVAVRVYSLHLATWVEVSPTGRRDQARAVGADALTAQTPVIIGGDFNSHSVGEVLQAEGFTCATCDVGATAAGAALDHLYLRGLRLRDSASVGKLGSSRGASDHLPVWAVLERDAGAESTAVRRSESSAHSPAPAR